VTAEGARPKRDRPAELTFLTSLPARSENATDNALQEELLRDHDSFIAEKRVW
jgi:hypothetical protein